MGTNTRAAAACLTRHRSVGKGQSSGSRFGGHPTHTCCHPVGPRVRALHSQIRWLWGGIASTSPARKHHLQHGHTLAPTPSRLWKAPNAHLDTGWHRAGTRSDHPTFATHTYGTQVHGVSSGWACVEGGGRSRVHNNGETKATLRPHLPLQNTTLAPLNNATAASQHPPDTSNTDLRYVRARFAAVEPRRSAPTHAEAWGSPAGHIGGPCFTPPNHEFRPKPKTRHQRGGPHTAFKLSCLHQETRMRPSYLAS